VPSSDSLAALDMALPAHWPQGLADHRRRRGGQTPWFDISSSAPERTAVVVCHGNGLLPKLRPPKPCSSTAMPLLPLAVLEGLYSVGTAPILRISRDDETTL